MKGEVDTLVVTSRPPGGEGWADLLGLAQGDPNWVLLFYGDGVYGLRLGSPAAVGLKGWSGGILAVADDLAACGGADAFEPQVRGVSYGEIVDIMLKAKRTLSWS